MNKKYWILPAVLLFIFCCKEEENLIGISLNTRILEHDVYTRSLSLSKAGSGLVCTYGDEITLSLKQAKVAEKVEVSYIDNIDLQSRLNPLFGKHYYFDSPQAQDVFYFDYQKKDQKFFKYLSRENEENLFSIHTLPINCQNFCVTEYDGKYLILYSDTRLKIGFVENNTFTPLKVNHIEYSPLEMKLVKAGSKLYLVFIDQRSRLCYSQIEPQKEGGFYITHPRLIGEQVKLFDVTVKDGKPAMLYYKNDYSLSYYDGESRLVGYYADLYELHLTMYRDKPLFLYVAFEEKQEAKGSAYYLYTSYEYSPGKWAEEKLYTSQTPLFSMDSLTDQKEVKIVLGGTELILLTLHITGWDEKKTELTIDIPSIIRYNLNNVAG